MPRPQDEKNNEAVGSLAGGAEIALSKVTHVSTMFPLAKGPGNATSSPYVSALDRFPAAL